MSQPQVQRSLFHAGPAQKPDDDDGGGASAAGASAAGAIGDEDIGLDTSASGSQLGSQGEKKKKRVPRKRKRSTSNSPGKPQNRVMWQFFDREEERPDDKEHRGAICKVMLPSGKPCGSVLKRSDASSSGMRNHLKHLHPKTFVEMRKEELTNVVEVEREREELVGDMEKLEKIKANRMREYF